MKFNHVFINDTSSISKKLKILKNALVFNFSHTRKDISRKKFFDCLKFRHVCYL